jgi:hypothetical protein
MVHFTLNQRDTTRRVSFFIEEAGRTMSIMVGLSVFQFLEYLRAWDPLLGWLFEFEILWKIQKRSISRSVSTTRDTLHSST